MLVELKSNLQRQASFRTLGGGMSQHRLLARNFLNVHVPYGHINNNI